MASNRRLLPLRALLPLVLLASCASVAERDGNEGGRPDAEGVDPVAHAREGDRAASNGEFDKALVQYAMALEEDGGNAELYYKVGFIHQSQGRTELAERGFREALEHAPEHLPSRISLGKIALRREDYRSAERLLSEVLVRDPDNWRALNAMGVLRDVTEDFDAARTLYERALEQVPESADVLNNLGYSRYLQGDLAGAERYFERVIERNPDHARGWSNLALVYLRLGDDDRAKMAFGNVVEEHQALNNMGYFDLLRERRESARARFASAARVAPSYYAIAQRNLAAVDADGGTAERAPQR